MNDNGTRLSDYLAGELSSEQLKQLKSELAENAELRNELAAMQQAFARIEQALRAPAPSFSAGEMASLRQKMGIGFGTERSREKRQPMAKALRLIGWGGAVAACLALVVVMLRHTISPDSLGDLAKSAGSSSATAGPGSLQRPKVLAGDPVAMVGGGGALLDATGISRGGLGEFPLTGNVNPDGMAGSGGVDPSQDGLKGSKYKPGGSSTGADGVNAHSPRSLGIDSHKSAETSVLAEQLATLSTPVLTRIDGGARLNLQVANDERAFEYLKLAADELRFDSEGRIQVMPAANWIWLGGLGAYFADQLVGIENEIISVQHPWRPGEQLVMIAHAGSSPSPEIAIDGVGTLRLLGDQLDNSASSTANETDLEGENGAQTAHVARSRRTLWWLDGKLEALSLILKDENEATLAFKPPSAQAQAFGQLRPAMQAQILLLGYGLWIRDDSRAPSEEQLSQLYRELLENLQTDQVLPAEMTRIQEAVDLFERLTPMTRDSR